MALGTELQFNIKLVESVSIDNVGESSWVWVISSIGSDWGPSSPERSKLEIERKLEQLRAMENGMSIHVGYVNASPLSVDTEEDLEEIKKIMKTNE